MLNILTEPLIQFYRSDGVLRKASLPEVYAALMVYEVEAFLTSRPHQHHAIHAFLVQLAAMSMHCAGLNTPPFGAAEWLRIIRALTTDWPDDEPWQLMVGDITQPAFMQPPARSPERAEDYKSRVETPDQLDMLVTSKNHDLKAEVAEQASVDDWIFALITLQTMEGFGGAGNYGISRMNGGLGNRPAFTLAPFSPTRGAHVRRDSIALLEFRQRLLNNNPQYPANGGEVLLWTLPWDGTPSEVLLPNRLDPLYIEVCRRIRLCTNVDGSLYGIRTSSKAARIEGKALKGRTGDPWTPTNSKREGLPLTLGAGGFNYKRITEYLTSADWERPALLHPTQAEQDSSQPMQLVARAMVRGQGKTEGYHERIIPIGHKGPKSRSAMLRRNDNGADDSDDLGRISKSRIDDVGKIQRILSHAIQSFLARGDSDNATPEQRNLARGWLNRLDDIVDATFFDDLQDELEAGESERQSIHDRWLLNDDKTGVINHARALLDDATDSLPCPSIHRYKARTNAEGLFEGRIRGSSGFPDLFPPQGGSDDQHANND